MESSNYSSNPPIKISKYRRLIYQPWFSILLALLGGLICLLQMFNYSHTQVSVLDEGAYLYKGFLFLRGDYDIYQDYGPWSNHMPLSFLIPGTVQYLFGPGLGAGRNFSILLTMSMLAGLWVIVRRFSGVWWGALAVWIFAFNPAVLKIYSVAVPQSLVICMLVWTLALSLGGRRPLWQLILASVISGLMVMTRINMLPVPPLLVLYILWQFSIKTGLLCGMISLGTILVAHALYWPEILKMWALQLPRSVLPVLDSYRSPVDKTPVWNPDVSIQGRLLSFLHAIRIHFVPIVGVISTLFLWPKKSKWPNSGTFKAVVFLLTLFSSLLLIHFWAALFQDYCVFCLSGYIGYFGTTGLLIGMITIPYWTRSQPLWKQILIAGFILTLTTAAGFSSFEDTAQMLMNFPIPRLVVDFPDISPGFVSIDKILINKFNLEFSTLRRTLPTLFGLFAGILVLLFGFLLNRYQRKKQQKLKTTNTSGTSTAYWSLVVLLIAGIFLAPSVFLGGAGGETECSHDVIASYKEAGEHLTETVPPGSTTFWFGGLSVAPLLNAPDINIYPPQINDGYSYFLKGDAQELYKFGYWTRDLAKNWMREADYILIEERSYDDWRREEIEAGGYEELEATPLQVQCRENSWIHVFKRIP